MTQVKRQPSLTATGGAVTFSPSEGDPIELGGAGGVLIAAASFKADGTVLAARGCTVTKVPGPTGRYDVLLANPGSDTTRMIWHVHEYNISADGSGTMNGATLEVQTLTPPPTQTETETDAFVWVWRL